MEKPIKVTDVPQPDSIQELAQFWDAHDLTDFEEQLEVVTPSVFELGAAEDLPSLEADWQSH